MPRLSTILGPDGERIDLDELFGPEKAGPTLTGVRSPISGHPAEGLTPARLAAIHRAAAMGDATAYLELAEDIEERDPHYLTVLGTRKRAVAQLPITVEAATDDPEHVKHADLIREWLNGGALDAALFDILDALGKGFSVHELEWESTPQRVVPKDLIYRPPQWFTFDQTDLETILLNEGVTGEPLAPHKFLVHRHKAKSGITIRSGLARVASWSWMFKSFTLKDWAVFVQNYGTPIRIGKYDSTASKEDKEVLWRAVANIAGDCAAIIPKGMEIEFISLKDVAKGAEVYEKRCDWLDRQISKLVLGQTTTTDAVSGGHAVAKEHRLVQEDIERADAKLVSATLTRHLVPYIIAFNFGPQEKYPRILIGRPDEVPLPVVIEAIYKLGPLGLTVEASQLRDRLGFAEPAADAVVIGGRKAEPGSTDASQHGRGPLDRLRHLMSRHSSAPEPEVVDRLTERLAEDAAGALAGLTDEIRQVFDSATDLTDLMARLEELDLDQEQYQAAMARGVALAQLAGQAFLLDELKQ
ncbi:DUF935 domain-containing protein [Microvirga terricola]|uniref:DUF935 domain-containing protein n=1 Tax=Microvirga terricola TaxID=2719797 RepID=A0ABX0V8S7_9HYPH|nr:DUF935 domain-containing protein [Microvirga terricola]NIX75396.1 DUF935 domain-containing protein [Microvirga terricola]